MRSPVLPRDARADSRAAPCTWMRTAAFAVRGSESPSAATNVHMTRRRMDVPDVRAERVRIGPAKFIFGRGKPSIMASTT